MGKRKGVSQACFASLTGAAPLLDISDAAMVAPSGARGRGMLTEPQTQTIDVIVCALILLGYALYRDAAARR